MRTRCGFWVVLLAVFSLFAFVTPHAAQAEQSPTAQMCADGSFDQKVENNRNSASQDRQQLIVNVTNQFPVIAATNACVENIIKVLTALPKLSDPFSLGNIIIPIVLGIIGEACSAVMSQITQAQSLLANTLSICLPLPNFSLNFGSNLQSTHCSGGIQFNLINGYSPSVGTSYSASGLLQH